WYERCWRTGRGEWRRWNGRRGWRRRNGWRERRRWNGRREWRWRQRRRNRRHRRGFDRFSWFSWYRWRIGRHRWRIGRHRWHVGRRRWRSGRLRRRRDARMRLRADRHRVLGTGLDRAAGRLVRRSPSRPAARRRSPRDVRESLKAPVARRDARPRPHVPCMAGGTDFSLVDGGPLVALLRRLGWRRPDGRIDYLRACTVLVAIAWGPLLLATLSARLMSGQSFVIDWGVHARLLVAIPLLLRADVSLHERTRFVVGQFITDRWVAEQRERFDRIVASAVRNRDSIFPEVLLFGLALLASELVVWNLGGTPFLSRRLTMDRHLLAARWWYALVALPMFQFLVYRALWRWAIWVQMLW